ncbi:MAG: flavin reductase family protein [Alphaproteobacteria bacterium]|nr:flavin reductase family protein [Alphaproteobacteria bacterium SS10]
MPDPAAAIAPQLNQTANAFRLAMRSCGQTVTVIAMADPESGERYGLTASSVTSLSMEPPSLVACINRDAKISPHIEVGTLLSINILGDDQSAISNAFATEPEPGDRFRHGDWQTDPDGVPYLADALGHVVARIASTTDHGTHTVVIADVTAALADPTRQPLIYHDGAYRQLGDTIS